MDDLREPVQPSLTGQARGLRIHVLALSRTLRAGSSRCRRIRGGILDCRCARRSARRQVGTKGWSYSDRTKGCRLDLNSTALAHHAQFAELDAHNWCSVNCRRPAG
jgi:hypothetical protein